MNVTILCKIIFDASERKMLNVKMFQNMFKDSVICLKFNPIAKKSLCTQSCIGHKKMFATKQWGYAEACRWMMINDDIIFLVNCNFNMNYYGVCANNMYLSKTHSHTCLQHHTFSFLLVQFKWISHPVVNFFKDNST